MYSCCIWLQQFCYHTVLRHCPRCHHSFHPTRYFLCGNFWPIEQDIVKFWHSIPRHKKTCRLLMVDVNQSCLVELSSTIVRSLKTYVYVEWLQQKFELRSINKYVKIKVDYQCIVRSSYLHKSKIIELTCVLDDPIFVNLISYDLLC